jgi:uncharacterized protein YjdB
MTTLVLTVAILACASDAVDPAADIAARPPFAISPERNIIAAVGGTVTLAATLIDGDDHGGPDAIWTSLEPGVLSFMDASAPSAEVVVIGLERGIGRIVAVYGSLADTAYVAVAPGTESPWDATGLVLEPQSDSIAFIGGKVGLTATVLDFFGNPMPDVSVAWSSLDPHIAVVDSAGVVTGISGGTARITATFQALSDTSRVVVVASSTIPERLAVAPKWAYLSGVGSKLLLSAAVYDDRGRLVANPPIEWESLAPAIASVSTTGEVTAQVEEGAARIVARSNALADTATVTISTRGTWSLTPIQLMPVTGPLVSRNAGRLPSIVQTYDDNFAKAEQGLYTKFLACQATCLLEPNHYGGLRSRLMWAIRNGEPIGPDAHDVTRHTYARGRYIVHSYLAWAAPEHNKRPDQNTGLADAETVWVLDRDTLGFNHVWGSAHRYTEDRFNYQNCINAASDPRQAAVPLQAFNIAHRLKVPFQRFPRNASGWDGSQGSWKATGERQIRYIRDNCVKADGSVPSKAHGQEAFLFNAMIADELLAWARDVEFKQEYVDLARLIVDHLINEYVTKHQSKGWQTLPYTTNSTIAATDLAGFYIWPSLVIWQETGSQKYYDFAMTNIRAANRAYLASIKQFNQTYSTMGMGAETILQGVRWR